MSKCGQQFFGVALSITSLGGDVNVCEPLAGTLMAAFACSQRGQLQAIYALVGRSDSFKIDAQTKNLCQQLGLDADWLASEAAATTAYSAAQIAHEARQLAAALADQMRLAGLEREVESLSSQFNRHLRRVELDLPPVRRDEGQPQHARILQRSLP